MGIDNEHKILVTQSFLPSKQEYIGFLDSIWESCRLTNNGTLEERFGLEIQNYTGAQNVVLCANGTLAIQLALRAFGVAGGEVITTPFSFVATSSAIAWEGAKPVFADIDYENLVPTPQSIADCITEKTKAILCVHIFGIPSYVEELEALARDRGIPLIFDAAHCFGSIYNGKSLLTYGDISTCSFHATKAFHSAEGGAIICKDEAIAKKISRFTKFGFMDNEYVELGINAKLSELHAAMGLAVLPHLDAIIEARRIIAHQYSTILPLWRVRSFEIQNKVQRHNYCYYPLLMETEEQLLRFMQDLETKNIYARRYFYPSLDTLSYFTKSQVCPVSRDIASRIVCLPLYMGMSVDVVKEILTSLRDILFFDRTVYINKCKTKPKVSVATITFNQENYIEECIKSIANQECDFPIEHIIGEDASSDRTQEIIKDYASKYKHIRPLFQPERTYGRGNLRAVYAALQAPYVAMCEGDDFFIDPHKLQKQVVALDEHPEVSLCTHPVELLLQETGQKDIFPKKEENYYLKPKNFFDLTDLLKGNFIQTNAVMYRWRFPSGVPRWVSFDVMPHDWYMHILHAETGKILYLPEIMSCYRRHSQGLWGEGAFIGWEAHIAKWAYSRILLDQVVDRHFNGQYRHLLDINLDYIFSHLIRYFSDKDPSGLEFYQKLFPDQTQYYQEYVRHHQ